MRKVVLERVVLLHKDLVLATIPATGPVFVGPHQDEREFLLLAVQYRFDRLLEQLSTVEPVVVVRKCVDSSLSGQVSLSVTYLRISKVVVAEV